MLEVVISTSFLLMVVAIFAGFMVLVDDFHDGH